jgi:hypothetical protein
LTGAYNTALSTATLSSGELRVRIPKAEERRGREIMVQVRRPSST